MSTYSKAMSVAVIVLLIAMVASHLLQSRRHAAAIARLETTLSECRLAERDANAAIERQNAAIEAVRVDTVVIEKLIKGAERKYVEIREVIKESIKEDSSNENQVNSIDFALRRFHGVGVGGLRIKNSD